MKIYFEDDKLSEALISKINPKCMVIDAAKGASYCKRCLDFANENYPHTTMVYTNSTLALNNHYVWNDELKAPELYVRCGMDYIMNYDKEHGYMDADVANGWVRIDNLTDRELRKWYDIRQLYLAGEFDK